MIWYGFAMVCYGLSGSGYVLVHGSTCEYLFSLASRVQGVNPGRLQAIDATIRATHVLPIYYTHTIPLEAIVLQRCTLFSEL